MFKDYIVWHWDKKGGFKGTIPLMSFKALFLLFRKYVLRHKV